MNSSPHHPPLTTPAHAHKHPHDHAHGQGAWTPLQDHMRATAIDAWVVFDLRGSSQVLPRLLGGKHHLTRRVFWMLKAGATDPRVICHAIDAETFAKLAIPHTTYAGWADLPAVLRHALAGCGRVAMEYSPGGALPVASTVDAGTIDLVRSLGVEVVGSADLVQLWAARWSGPGLAAHRAASTHTQQIVTGAFDLMTRTVARDGQCQERDVQLYIIEQFKARKLTWPDDPIVAVNANSASPHYAPDQHRSTPITPGDWVLIDLWCREEAPAGTGQAPLGDDAIYSDITWTGYVGPRVPPTHQRVFDVVRDARDAALHLAQQAWQAGTPVQGWQLDDAARAVLIAAGLGPHIKHRTGHSLSPGPLVHGIGMNLDNLESHDTRRMLPQTGFTIEPGAYGVIDDHGRAFGVRNEINVYVDPQLGPVVTSCVQNQPVLIA